MAGVINLNDGTSIEPCAFDTGGGFDGYTGPMQEVRVLYRSKRKTIQRVCVYAFKSYGKDYDQLCANGMRGMIDYLGLPLDAWTGNLGASGSSLPDSLIGRVCREGTKEIVPLWRAKEEEGAYQIIPDFPLSYTLISRGCWGRKTVSAKVEVYGFASFVEKGFTRGFATPRALLWGTSPVYPVEAEDERRKFALLYNDGNHDW